MALISIDDLTPFAEIETVKAEAMIADAVAAATLNAPCLADEASLTDRQKAAAKALLRAAVLRWNEAGASGGGAVSQQTAGVYSQSLDTRRRNMFWPSEITDLQKICASGSGAFSIDTAPDPMRFRAGHGLGFDWPAS